MEKIGENSSPLMSLPFNRLSERRPTATPSTCAKCQNRNSTTSQPNRIGLYMKLTLHTAQQPPPPPTQLRMYFDKQHTLAGYDNLKVQCCYTLGDLPA